ncbi:MAG TPA: succinate--CoA ligase subunit beta, partial [Gemmatimonadetes bacterium]|nr:succinate--CoA ligase subunit beta [Gemmatimonadota bacterium]
MDIHEYQAKERFRAAGIDVPPGEIATTPEEAETIAAGYGGTVVVKQIRSANQSGTDGVDAPFSISAGVATISSPA